MVSFSEVSLLDNDGIISRYSPEDILKQVIASECILKKKTLKEVEHRSNVA